MHPWQQYCLYRHADGEEKPSRRSTIETTQGEVAILKEKMVRCCVSQNSDPNKSILRKAGQTRLYASAGHALKHRTHLVRSSNSGKRRAISRRYPTGEPHERKSVRAEMQTNPDRQASESRGLAHTEDEMNEEDPTQLIPDWLQPFKDTLEDLETHVPAHPSEREISGSEGDASKLRHKKTEAQCLYSLP